MECCVLCCQISMLILVCFAVGFLVAIWFAHDYNVSGLEDLWNKFKSLFAKSDTIGTSTMKPQEAVLY